MTNETMTIVQQAADLARRGRLAEAADLLAPMSATTDDAVLLALGGAIALHRQRYDEAADTLGRAHRVKPDDVTVRANLAEALFLSGREDEVRALIDADSARADKSLRLARLGAGLAQQANDHEQAATLYRHVVESDPGDWSSWNNFGNSLGAIGDYDAAAAALEKAAALIPDAPPVRLNLGNALLDAGRAEEAEKVFRQAAEDFPSDPAPFTALFAMLREQGREDEAFEAIGKAAERAPDRAEIQSDFGQEAARRNLYDQAEGAFETALKLQPDLGASFVGLASVYERTNREDRLDALDDRAVVASVDDEPRAYIEALRHKRAGDHAKAFGALERAGEVVVTGRRLHMRGILLDHLGRHDEAFESFAGMNAHWQEDPTRPSDRAREYRDQVSHATALLTPQWLQSWTAFDRPLERPTPIFLVGFPRSGTTLLDTMLMSHPSIRVLEEEPFIGEIERELGGFDALSSLDADAIAAARLSYFERAGGVVDLKADSIVLDKHPMHLNKVATIRRLFPDAKFILALRHPCDVLLSCYLTNFRINNAMANFLDLEDAATLYDLTFAHWTKARELFELPVGTVVYERLIEDKDRELRPLFEWLGLGWRDDFGDHREAARARGTVRTASYSQVTEPLYRRAVGRWTRYREQLNPVFPVLRPWIEQFGYSLDDGRIPDWPE